MIVSARATSSIAGLGNAFLMKTCCQSGIQCIHFAVMICALINAMRNANGNWLGLVVGA